jgi:phosphate transport system permease protein
MTRYLGRASFRSASSCYSLILRGASVASAGVIVLILAFVLAGALPALRQVGPFRFVSDSDWYPVQGLYRLTPMIIGTLSVAGLAVAVATPVGIACAIFARYYAPQPVAAVQRSITELLSGIPSVVYGFWGLVALVPLVARSFPPGASLLVGGIVLGLMVLPTMALTADAAFGAVPKDYLENAAALGMSKATVLYRVVLPCARSGLVTGILLESGRALGETMAVLMVSGNVVRIPDSLFSPVRTLTANIALEMAYATGTHRSALFVSGTALGCLVIVLVVLAQRVSLKSRS